MWILAFVVLVLVSSAVGGQPVDNFRLPNSDAQRAADLLDHSYRAEAGSSALVVFHSREGTLTDDQAVRTIRAGLDRVEHLPHVTRVSDPLQRGSIASDRTIAWAEVKYDRSTDDLGRAAYTRLDRAVQLARDRRVEAEIGGPLAVWEHTSGSTEWVGVVVAMVVFTIVFGSMLAMWLPIGLALVSVLFGQILIGLLSGFVDVPSSTPDLLVMIGLGVALDYALFIVTRALERVRTGESPEAAAGHATATAGVAVLFAGSTVIVAICGLALSGIWAIGVMGFGVAIAVAVTVIAALTLLPAMLGLLGRHAVSSRFAALRRATGHEDRRARRWAERIVQRPTAVTIASLAILLLLASPVLALRLGQTDAGTAPPTSSQRHAFDLLARGFGPGFNGPLIIVADGTAVQRPTSLSELTAALRADRDVAAVSPPVLNPARSIAVMKVFPRTSPHSQRTAELVDRLRARVIPMSIPADLRVLVGGNTAAFVDMAEQMQVRLPLLIGAVVLVSFLLLMVGFRSIVVPLKAAAMNVLSVGVGYGVLVAVFQWGWGKGVIGLEETVPIMSWVPLVLFAILFGLSMDYEVFLISAIRDRYHLHRDNRRAVVEGLSSTARIITAAALVMLAVFASFVVFPDPVVKMIGLGLAVSVLIDATVVRMALVPAAMVLLGDANWWLPSWLDRRLPTIDLEGRAPTPVAVPAPSTVDMVDDADEPVAVGR